MTEIARNGRRLATPIAIVGMGCLFPDAAGLRQYWNLLREGRNAVGEVPASHWRAEDYLALEDDGSGLDRTYCARGGFLDPVPFDPAEFGVPPSVLEATDTAQLLSLVVGRMALEDAGYGAQREFARDRCSVLLGVTGALELVVPLGARLGHPHWRRAMQECGIDPAAAQRTAERMAEEYVQWQENSFPGLLGNVVAGRIANRLNLRGTNCVVDAACASSLSALHLAALELASGHSDMVLTGGVDAFNDIFMFMCFTKTQALSRSGDARPFDAGADGTVLGEGVGMVVLKRLEDAQRDGDRVYAVLKGLGSSSDGKSQSIYAPRAEGQAAALRSAYELADVPPATVELVEAHGTGTRVGDVVEFDALTQVYRESDGEARQWCALGSVKSQIGHTKAAAGAASLIKSVLALYHKVLPPTIKVDTPNPKLGLAESPFYLPTETRPWISLNGAPRRAAVSAFGFGGSNFHAVLEEARPEKTEAAWDGSVQMFAFSAAADSDLAAALEDAARECAALAGDAWAWRAQTSRAQFDVSAPCRAVIVAHDAKELTARASAAATALRKPGAKMPPHVFTGHGPAPGKVALLFPGQGSQYVGMGSTLLQVFPEAHDAFTAAARDAAAEGCPLAERVYPRPEVDPAAKARQQEELTATDTAQPALAAVCAAYREVLAAFGVQPDVTAGHSFGEVPALWAAGRLATQDLHRLARLRGRLMAEAGAGDGGMLAVQAPLDELERVMAQAVSEVVLANRNAPRQGILSGPGTALAKAEEVCRAQGWAARTLNVAAAFHTKELSGAAAKFADVARSAARPAGPAQVYANATAEPYGPAADDAARLLGQQIDSPVRFVEMIERLHSDGVRIFVEAGPKSVLTGLVQKILDGRPHVAAATDTGRDADALVALADTLGALAAAGVAVNLAAWEAPIAEPRRPVMTVPILGINYRAPQTQNERPAPRPAQPVAVAAAPLPAAPSRPAQPAAAPAHASASALKVTNMKPAISPPATAPASAPQPEAVAQILAAVQSGLAAMQHLQQQTAAAHERFLETQQQAQASFQSVFAQQQRLLELALGGSATSAPLPAIAPAPAPAFPATPPATTTIEAPAAPFAPPAPAPAPAADTGALTSILLATVAELTGYPAEMLDLGMDLEADLGIDSIKRVEILAELTKRLPNAPAVEPSEIGTLRTLQQVAERLGSTGAAAPAAPGPAAPAVAPPSGGALDGALLAVVSELTGYPAEMLDLGMDLEADLGIDSIKRVEIFATLQKRHPELPHLEAGQLGSARTLAQALALLGASVQPSAAPATAPAPAALPDLAPVLFEAVAELTGYPAEMLELGMDLEADLGIDSIKRVEILATLQKRLPAMQAIDSGRAGALRTLGQIIEALGSAAAPAATAPAAPSPAPHAEVPTPAAAPEAIGRAFLRAIPISEVLPGEMPLPAGAEVCLIAEPSSVLADPLAAVLTEAGWRVTRTSPADARDVHESAPPAGLVILADAPPPPGQLLPAEDDAFLEAVLKAAAHWASAGSTAPRLIASVTAMDGQFGLTAAPARPLTGALAGLIKTAARELPHACARAIDVLPGSGGPRALAEAVMHELRSDGPLEVGLAGGQRFGLRTEDAPPPEANPVLQAGEVVLVTGGARGITADCALALACQTPVHLALLGRTPAPGPEAPYLAGVTGEAAVKRAILEHEFAGQSPRPSDIEAAYRRAAAARELASVFECLSAAGASYSYHTADVRSMDELRDAVAVIRHDHGPVRGLIHAAGVIADCPLARKNASHFQRVYGTKIGGLRALLDVLPAEDLRLIAFFSSVSGRYGREGQADYAMANEALNKTAQALARALPACRVVSLNWGPWDGGMVSDALRREFQQIGVVPIPRAAGAAAFAAEVQGSPGAVEVVLGSGFPAPAGGRTSATTTSAMTTVMRRALDLASNAFLDDHRIGGEPVLPAAVMMEWMAQAALQQNPGLRFAELRNLRIAKAVRVNGEAAGVEVRCGKPRRESDDSFAVPCEIAVAAGSGTEVHATAETVLAASAAKAPAPAWSLAQVSGSALTASDIYDGALFHGPTWQVVAVVTAANADGLTAHLGPSVSPDDLMTSPLRRHWVTDPLRTDGALQLGLVYRHDRGEPMVLPIGFGSYRQFGTFPAEGVVAGLRVTHSDPARLTGDVLLTDASGRVVAFFERIEWRLAPMLQGADSSRTNR